MPTTMTIAMPTVARRAFTIVELLVVVSIIALLIGILLPAIGKARENARLTQSKSNLRQLGQAAGSYASDWGDRQFTPVNDNLARYGTSIIPALGNFNNANGTHPPIIAGWGDGGSAWGWWFSNPASYGPLLQPINFEGTFIYFGWFRRTNLAAFNHYLGDRAYDPVYWAPKDRVVLSLLEGCFNKATYGDCYQNPSGYGGDGDGNVLWPSYCYSPAALFSPDVFRNPEAGGWQDPFDLGGGALRAPGMSQARYSDLKSHMLEHHWLQNSHMECNPNFYPGSFEGCEPYYFNHGYESVPMTLFYDSHVEGLGVPAAQAADNRHNNQVGYGLWSRDTPFGTDGYLISDSWDFLAETSFHVLSTDGILGRDWLGQ